MLEEYKDVLTVDEVADILKVNKKVVYSLLQDNALLHVRVGRQYRINKNSLISFLTAK